MNGCSGGLRLALADMLGEQKWTPRLYPRADKGLHCLGDPGLYIPSIHQQVFIKHLLGSLAFAVWPEQGNYLISPCVREQKTGQGKESDAKFRTWVIITLLARRNLTLLRNLT